MLLLLINKDTCMDGGSGDVECEGMSIGDDESEDTGITVDVDVDVYVVPQEPGIPCHL